MSLALFDFDGTITTNETMPEFVRRSVERPRLLLDQLLLGPIVVGYKLGLVSGTAVRRAIVRLGYHGSSVASVDLAGQDFARDYLPTVLRPQAMQRIAWHREQGHTVAVVSGGLENYLAPWCQEHGLDLICSSLEQRDGCLTGRYLGAQCVLAEKSRRVRERYDLPSYSSIYAYGDTPEDDDLLSIATHRYYRWQQVSAAGGH